MLGAHYGIDGFTHLQTAVYFPVSGPVLKKVKNMKSGLLLLSALCFSLLASAASYAETTTTTTTTNTDGSTTTTVEETATTETTEPSSQDGVNLVGPAGVTGAIRRSDRRQDRRLEEDLDDLGDAIDRRPRR